VTTPSTVIVHDYLLQDGGAERVLNAIAGALPDAPIVTSMASDDFKQKYSRRLITTYLQRAPVNPRTFRVLFPLYGHAFMNAKLPAADVALVSSSGWAHYVALHSKMPVVVYCHTPARWLWRGDEYFRSTAARYARKGMEPLFRRLREIDREAAISADRYIANSENVRERIRGLYGRDAEVLHPPVNVETFHHTRRRRDYFLVASRLLQYKRIDLAVDACTQLGRRLVVTGEGPALAGLRRRAGDTVKFLGWQPDHVVHSLMEGCRALIFPGCEDFGLAPVEAMAAGAPVIGFKAGGALETVVPGVTGVLFSEPTVDAVKNAIQELESRPWSVEASRDRAEHFGRARFDERLREIISEVENDRSVKPAITERGRAAWLRAS